ncbi:MAG TPA: Fe-S cluster assembly protein SufB, partial [Deltaproteobacteria bacterium]|nr:Fe-S cluster assembly protein SufB [Deltaproteobacteria bacterium]
MSNSKLNKNSIENIGDQYDEKYGFHKPENYSFKSKRGLNRAIVEEISKMKQEPQWMLDFRLRALEIFNAKPMPNWGDSKLLNEIQFDNIFYYIKPGEKQSKDWNEVPKDIKDTFDKLGIPEAERKFLAGVTAQYESEVVYHSIRKDLEAQGVIFLDMDSGLREHPDIVKKYFGTIIPPMDNKFSALNSAVWSGGSFIYVPKGVKVSIPLQAYFRINAANMGQFERTLIIADEGSFVHYVEGCFTKETMVKTNPSLKTIVEVKVGDRVLTHTGEYRKVYQTQKRKYSGDLYSVRTWGDSTLTLNVTADHPFLCVRRNRANERNSVWLASWIPVKNLKKRDYLLIPVDGK